MSVGDLAQRDERPPYVKFETVPVEDTAASREAGHYVARDVDYALITPPYSKDVFKTKVSQWIENMKQDVAQGRLPEKWAEDYKEAYRRWKVGQAVPLNGTPIKGWGVISPAQQETLIRMNVLTVEDLAQINDEGVRRIGMGAADLKNKANAWLAQMTDKGPLTMEMAALRNENDVLRGSVATLEKQVAEFARMVTSPAPQPAPTEDISASDILDDDSGVMPIHAAAALAGISAEDAAAIYKQKFGKAPHPAMKPETLAARVKE